VRFRTLLALLKWPAALAALAGLLWLGYLGNQWARQRRAAEAVEETPKRAANRVIKLGAVLARSLGLEDEQAVDSRWQPRAAAYGRVVPNPRATTEVRVAFGGVLRAPEQGAWPKLGDRVKAGQVLARLDVRVGPQERLDLTTKLDEARLKLKGAEEHVRINQARYDRLRRAGDGVSRSELDAARKDLTEARTQQETAAAAVKGWQKALDAITGRTGGEEKTWTQPLTCPSEGEVVEAAGRPGVAIEAGGLVVRVVDFRAALVRLELPPEALAEGPPEAVEVFAQAPIASALEGASNRPEPPSPAAAFSARLVGPAPHVEVASQHAAYWYEADVGGSAGSGWRPGLFVKALVKSPGEAAKAVAVPRGALLYHEGRALVYVRLSPGRFERREVRVLGGEGERWVLSEGVAAGEAVVSRRAQVLLSEEFRQQVDDD
jgi:hypothetical protein